MNRDYKALIPFTQAVTAVGSNPTERLAWLDGFVKRELDTQEQRLVAATEVQAFMFQHASEASNYALLKGFSRDPDSVEVMQQMLRELLNAVTMPATTGRILQDATSAILRPSSLAQSTPALGDLATAALSVLLQVGPRLRRCSTPSCGRLFAYTKVSQVRCRPNCGVTERVRAWRDQNRPKVRESQHKRYAKRVRAKRAKDGQPNVRVVRRPRKPKGD